MNHKLAESMLVITTRARAALVALMLTAAILAGSARAAVVHDATSVSFSNGSSLAFPHTVGLGVDRALVVGVSIFNANKTVTAVAYNGVAFTRLGFLDGGTGSNDRRMEMWILVNPPIGTANVDITMSGGAKFVAGAASFFGVNTLAPTGAFLSNEARTNLATLTVPSAAGELVFDVLSATGNAATAVVGPGQTQLWNDYSRSNGGAVVGTASTEPGAASVTMSWNLSSVEYWVIGAVALKPAPPRPYLADAMIRTPAEPATAAFYDNWYENPAAYQIKAQAVLASVPATYLVRLENDGQNPDAFTVSGTAGTATFVAQYLDGAGIDRTAAVTGGGHVDAVLASGAATVWTVVVTPVIGVAAGGAVFTVDITATSTGDPLVSDQVRAITTCTSPNLAITKAVDLANALPGQDITYSMSASSAGGLSNAAGIVVVDSIPDYAGFRIGSATFLPGTSGLTSSISYSNDNGLTWTYAPGTGSCSAPAGYDYCVTHVRWSLAGTMPPDRTFLIGMAVRVK